MKAWSLVLLLAGCVSLPPSGYVYRKPGSTEATYNEDIYACERDAAPVQNVIQKRQMMNRCMSTKGWTATLERF